MPQVQSVSEAQPSDLLTAPWYLAATKTAPQQATEPPTDPGFRQSKANFQVPQELLDAADHSAVEDVGESSEPDDAPAPTQPAKRPRGRPKKADGAPKRAKQAPRSFAIAVQPPGAPRSKPQVSDVENDEFRCIVIH